MGSSGSRSYSERLESYTTPLGKGPKSDLSKDDECSKISYNAVLQNIDPFSISTIKKDDILRVKNNPKNGINTVIVTNDVGKIFGYLISPKTVKLIECIQKGNIYIATVLEIKDTTVRVHITKKN